MAAAATQDNDIRKYEEIGTHPAANHNAISAALAFHRGIGVERKAARLRYLRDRWALRLAQNPKCRILHSTDPAQSCGIGFLTPLDNKQAGAIALFQVDGLDNVKLGAWLLNQHRIVNTPIVHPEFKGIRITPNVYTTLDEIDVFADKVLDAVKKGIPA